MAKNMGVIPTTYKSWDDPPSTFHVGKSKDKSTPEPRTKNRPKYFPLNPDYVFYFRDPYVVVYEILPT